MVESLLLDRGARTVVLMALQWARFAPCLKSWILGQFWALVLPPQRGAAWRRAAATIRRGDEANEARPPGRMAPLDGDWRLPRWRSTELQRDNMSAEAARLCVGP